MYRKAGAMSTATSTITLFLISFSVHSMNVKYAPYLPADEEGSATIDNYIRMLDKRYSLQPLIREIISSDDTAQVVEVICFTVFCHLNTIALV